MSKNFFVHIYEQDSAGALVTIKTTTSTDTLNAALALVTSIGSNGLRNAFKGCTGLTGSISFPELESIGNNGLRNAFEGCTGITSIHFPKALSGNSQCTKSNMGCSNATVYFDL